MDLNTKSKKILKWRKFNTEVIDLGIDKIEC
jgi:hypothetical protein